MKLRELIERLEKLDADLREGLGEDCDPEVVAAYQPTWPLTGEILHARVIDDDPDYVITHEGRPEGTPIVWIAVGGHAERLSPYAPRAAFEEPE